MQRLAAWGIAFLCASVVLSGCGTPPPATPTVVHMRFALESRGFVSGQSIRWTFYIQNAADTPSPPSHLDIFVRHMQSGVIIGGDHQTLELTSLDAGETRPFQADTPYHGVGDYAGVSNLTVNGHLLDKDLLFYEECRAMARC